jgi:hypothetical protein
MFNDLRREVIVGFVDIDGTADNQLFNQMSTFLNCRLLITDFSHFFIIKQRALTFK